MDTNDATGIDTALLGHSYYGDCRPLLEDVRLVIEQNLPPEQRNLRQEFGLGNLTYWAFDILSGSSTAAQ